MIFYILTAAVVALSLVLLLKHRDFFNRDIYKNFSDNVELPVLKFGFFVAFLDPVEIFTFLRNVAEKYRKSYVISHFGIEYFFVIRANDAEKVLNSSRHLEKSKFYKFAHPFIKTGLITSGGEKWRLRRKLLTPAFHFDILREFCEIFKDETAKLVDDLKLQCGNELNIFSILSQAALNMICESAMGVRLSQLGTDGVAYRRNIGSIGGLLTQRVVKPWLFIDVLYTILGYRRELNEIVEPVHEFTQRIIDKRRTDALTIDNLSTNCKKRKRYAMMDTLLQAQSQGLIDDDGIMEETDTFTFGGHDTTSSALTFTLLLLAHHPEVQKRLFEEIQDVTYGRDLTVDDLGKFSYMERVVKESLRLYPTVPIIGRKLTEDLQISGGTFKKGTDVTVLIYDIHRDPQVFPDPDKFDPDRFLPENCRGRNNFAFLPFSAGMRNCIGQKYAMLELKVVLTAIVRNFKILPVTQLQDVVLPVDAILRAKNPIKVKFALKCD